MSILPLGDVLVNGVPVAADAAMVSISDVGLLRGYGCFEALRVYEGVPFRLQEHLERLEMSARALHIPLPSRSDLTAWAIDRASGDVVVRIVVTGGTDLDALGDDSKVIVFAHAVPAPLSEIRLWELVAPWHPAGRSTQLAAAKTLSYAPNTAALLEARSHGFDDAVLVSSEGVVLELPMASIAWVYGGVVETPSLELGILRSVTRAAMIEVADRMAIDVIQGEFPRARMQGADEIFVMSTTKEIVPVVALGPRSYEPGPIAAQLTGGLATLIAAESSREPASG